jgi:hypothetical protein
MAVTDINKVFNVNEYAQTYLKGILVFDPDTKNWVRTEQPITEDQMSKVLNVGVLEVLSQILTELKVQTYYLMQGLNVKDEPESIRNEISTQK